jgi:hypothetical protein
MDKVAQNVKEGDERQFVVIEFDRTNKRVVLSRKKALDMEKESSGQAEKSEIEAFVGDNVEAPTLGEMAGEDVREEDKEEVPAKTKDKKATKKADTDKKAKKDEARSKEEGSEPVPPEAGTQPEEPEKGTESESEAEPEPSKAVSTVEPDDVAIKESKDITDEAGEEPKAAPVKKAAGKKKDAEKPPAADIKSDADDETAKKRKRGKDEAPANGADSSVPEQTDPEQAAPERADPEQADPEQAAPGREEEQEK